MPEDLIIDSGSDDGLLITVIGGPIPVVTVAPPDLTAVNNQPEIVTGVIAGESIEQTETELEVADNAQALSVEGCGAGSAPSWPAVPPHLHQMADVIGLLEALSAAGIIGDTTFRFVQGVASAIWLINHNLHRRPSVTIVDSTWRQVHGQVEYLDDETIRLTFSAAFSGEAYLN
jgi:hypothetical protein